MAGCRGGSGAAKFAMGGPDTPRKGEVWLQITRALINSLMHAGSEVKVPVEKKRINVIFGTWRTCFCTITLSSTLQLNICVTFSFMYV